MPPDLVIVLLVSLWLLASCSRTVWSTPTFNELDEGQHWYALTRLAHGEVPFANFYYLYGLTTLYLLTPPFLLFGQTLGAALFGLRIFAPILTLFLVMIAARLTLRQQWSRALFVLAVVAGDSFNFRWCPGFRIWIALLGIVALGSACFRSNRTAPVIAGVLLGLGFNGSADMAIVTVLGGAATLLVGLLVRGARSMVLTVGATAAGFVCVNLLLWSPVAWHGGLRRAAVLSSALLRGTNWYAGLPLPWPGELFSADAATAWHIAQIYGYFALLIFCLTSVAVWIASAQVRLRRGIHGGPMVQAAGLAAASAAMMGAVLGRTGASDVWRLSYAGAPLLLLLVLMAEQLTTPSSLHGMACRLTLQRARASLLALSASFVVFAARLLSPYSSPAVVGLGLAAPQELQGWSRSDAAPAWSQRIGIRLEPDSSFFREYERTLDFLQDHLQPGDSLYVAPWGPYNVLLGARNPTPVDILDNTAPEEDLQRDLVSSLEANPPRYIVLRHAYRHLSSSNNPELVTRRLLAFVERYYLPTAEFGLDAILERRATPTAPFTPVLVATWNSLAELPGLSYHGAQLDRSGLTAIGPEVLVSASFAHPLAADMAEIKLALVYPHWRQTIAEPSLTISCSDTSGVLRETLSMPTDGSEHAIRFYFGRSVDATGLTVELAHRGPLNPPPNAARVTALSLYQTGNRHFE